MKNLVISVPRLEIHRPPVSTAVVSEVIRTHGHDVQALDLNCEFFHHLADRQEYYSYDDIWDGHRDPTFHELKNILSFIKLHLPAIEKYDQLWISVFTSSAHLFTELLCRLIRKNLSKKKIILGGQGAWSTEILNKEGFGYKMKKKGLCDLYIVGEGEASIRQVLDGAVKGAGISDENPIQIDNLDILPYPNYSFYDLDRYDYLNSGKEVFITGSRGCVRRCTYCDVARYWPKFRYRSGTNIAEEMINHYEKHGINHFYFTDSLINGSMKAFNDMCDVLAKYNTNHKAGFSWKGQFIFRPKNQLPKNHFATVAAAGGKEFYVGVETGSDKIRWEMDKKFTNEDIDFQLEEFSKHGITVIFLMLIGYLTETRDDHNDTLQIFKRWQKYVATGTIKGIDLGKGLTFLTHTPLERMMESHGVYFLKENGKPNESLWQCTSNPSLSVGERIRRRIETHEEAIKYNWPIWRGAQRLNTVKIMANQYLNSLENSVEINQTNTKKKIVKENLNFFE